MRTQIINNEKSIEELSDSNLNQQNIINDSQKKIQELSSVNNNVQQSLEQIKLENDQFKQQIESKIVDINSLEKKNEEIQRELGDKTTENLNLVSKAATLSGEAITLENTVKEKLKAVEDITAERELLNEKIKASMQRLEENQRLYDALTTEKSILNENNKIVISELDQLKSQLQESQKTTNDLESKVNALSNENRQKAEEDT